MKKLAIGPAAAFALLGFSTTSLSYQNEPTALHWIAGTQLSAVQGELERYGATKDGDLIFARLYDKTRLGNIPLSTMVYDFRNCRITYLPESPTITAQNDTSQYLSRPEGQSHNYATQAYQQCMSHCGNMAIICNTDSDEESVYTPPSELCETKFHNCEADCAATLKRQWGPSTSEPPAERGNSTGKIGGGAAISGAGQMSASDAVTSSDQAVKDAKAAADSFERWYKTGHFGDLPKMKHYVAEAKAASDRTQAIAAAYPNDHRLEKNVLEAKLESLRVQVLAAKAQAIQDAINKM